MSFYKTLTPFYDSIFPANERAITFLASHFKKGGSLLDVGAGTGNMAIALSQQGFQVTATEPELGMVEQIRLKAQSCQNPVKIASKTMEQLNEGEETYDGIYCIGNTLAHLNNRGEIETFFQHAFQKLQEEGVFIFQIVNFERVLTKQDFTFPIKKTDTFEFSRQYELEGDQILFTSTLTVDGEFQTNTIPLFPATKSELMPLLKQCGFKTIDVYGNFQSKAYSIDSPALIVVAKKGI
ncbi:bifunctional 2-polyprenyl-6-hydroxyphenol methylase/3-demethylubiquinol 3-O-methyltransferase UbiG [Bacillus sp. V3B]|uniref:class I SAM-dependent methyltransferase n=1 Tax=Bacillus sp. V3B TaxID=2804915 RepID=UPI00210BD085|nr:class I SAM-dependent methyltransferase [Bacillus sp. V3B]